MRTRTRASNGVTCARAERVYSDRKPHRLSANVLDDVIRVVNVHSIKVDARQRTRVRDAVEDWRHTPAGAAPVRPEIDDGDAARVDLYIKGR
jgi:hypothetical protein